MCSLIKRMLAIVMILILSIESYAAVVSDNDGSAFVTKAEFEILKKDFGDQIEKYNTSIDSKIDGAIASYLSGIKLQRTEILDDLMKGNIISFVKNISLISTSVPNAITINYNIGVMHVTDAQSYGSSHYGSFELGNYYGKYNVFELKDGYNFYRGNAQSVESYSVYTYGGAFVRVDLYGGPHKIAINSDTGTYIRGISSDVRSTYGCNGSSVKTYGIAENTRSLFNTKLSSNQVEYLTFSRTDKIDKGSLTNDYSNYQYKSTANDTAYDMIDWANFTHNTTNTTYTVGESDADAPPNSRTGNIVVHIRFAGTYVTFKPKTSSLKMNELCNYSIYNISQLNVPLYGGVPICNITDNGKLIIKFDLKSSEPSTDVIKFYLADKPFEDSAPSQEIAYKYKLSGSTIGGGLPSEGTINPGEYLYTNSDAKVEIELDCEKNKTYYYKLDSSSDTSSVWAEISEIKLEKE